MPKSHLLYPIIQVPYLYEYRQILCVDYPMTSGPRVTLLGFRGEAESVLERTINIWSIPHIGTPKP